MLCGRADVELLDFFFSSFIIIIAVMVLTSPPCLQAGRQMASSGVPV